jgi:hypothetical protein
MNWHSSQLGCVAFFFFRLNGLVRYGCGTGDLDCLSARACALDLTLNPHAVRCISFVVSFVISYVMCH